MEGEGILQLLAELSIGVLGFSGVVAVLGRRRAGEWTPVDRFRFFFMVRLTALVLVLSLLPFPFYAAGVAAGSTWAWCSGTGAVLLVFITVASRVVEAAPQGLYTDPGTSRLALVYAVPASIGSLLLLVMNASGVILERSFATYLVALLLIFGIPVVLFVRLLHSALRSNAAG